MWLSDRWIDYELLDCSGGEKLERWGDFVLVRPDPQAIWKTEKTAAGWKNADARYIRSNSGGGRWENRGVPASWQISYGRLRFNVKLMNFKHTGIFPEQAANWDWIVEKVSTAGRPLNVLNLFAYTGAASLAAAAAGASVCHVDAARGMVAWARENAQVSGLSGKPIRWIVDDCAKFVEREIKRGRRYDAIIMDPPSYGRGPSGELWKLEDDLFDFVSLCSGVLSDDPSFVIINSYTTGLSPSILTYMCQTILNPRFGGSSESRELGLPVRSTGLALPCGATCRWSV
ncbi:MAG: class I SAM-dependent methyltransferase [Oscillospiraceae bacterium]|nr:class I SAM-dependent methyltransferase [Oscillospiraceae bacterium]